MNNLQIVFIIWAFLFQIMLIIHFALRKWAFDLAIAYGWIVYALSIPAFAISLLLLWNNQAWYMWLGGFIYLIWAILGYTVEYQQQIKWRNPIRWSIFGPYITLYLASIMFYWWPVGIISRPLWYVYAALFIISTVLNVISHKQSQSLISGIEE